MKESKKAILKSLSKTAKKNDRFDMLVLNMALQKIDCENFDFDGDAVYTVDHKYLIYCLSQKDSSGSAEGISASFGEAVVSWYLFQQPR